MDFKRDYASLSIPYAFKDGKRGNTKNVELCLVLGIGAEIAQVLEDGESDITEKGVKIKAKHCQVLDTYNKHKLLNVPTHIPPNVVN